MTERAGRHEAGPGHAETDVLAADRWPADGGPLAATPQAWRSRGRHAAPRPADEPGQAVAGQNGNPQNGRGPEGATRPEPMGDGALPLSAAAPGPGPEQSRAAAGTASRLRLVWVYPDLLSTYGDRGNLLVLQRRARLRGIDVEPVEVDADRPVPTHGDIYLLGGGEDLPQILAANRLRADGGLAAVAGRNGVVFAVCAGYQVLGHQFGGVEGEAVGGLGVLDITSGRGRRRGVGELVADVAPDLGVARLTGFENHQGVTNIGPGARPLARVSKGVGNGDGTEGAVAGKILGTYMHGPALARNPGLADLLLSWAVGPLAPIDPAAEEWAARLRAERLAAAAQ